MSAPALPPAAVLDLEVLESLADDVELGSVGLAGDPGVGVTFHLAELALVLRARGWLVGASSALRAPTEALLVDALARDLLDQVAADSPLEAHRKVGSLADERVAPQTLSELMESLRARFVFIVDDFDAATSRPAGHKLAWTLRSLMQNRHGGRLVLGARRAGLDRVASQDSALYTLATWTTIEPPDLRLLALSTEDRQRLTARTRGLPGPSFAAIRLGERLGIPAAEAFDVLLDVDVGRGETAVRRAHELHRLAGAVLVAIATGQRPYSAMAHEPRRVVHAALERLVDAGLVVRHGRGTYVCADPIVEGQLIARHPLRAGRDRPA